MEKEIDGEDKEGDGRMREENGEGFVKDEARREKVASCGSEWRDRSMGRETNGDGTTIKRLLLGVVVVLGSGSRRKGADAGARVWSGLEVRDWVEGESRGERGRKKERNSKIERGDAIV